MCLFYRATLCVSAVFAVTRCTCVRLESPLKVLALGLALADSIQTAKDIIKLLSLPGSPIILVF